MQFREIGRTGITVSVIGLGCNNFGMLQDAEQATRCIHQALDAGITFFDMASEHRAGIEEQLVGAALRGRRDKAVLATKVGQPELLGFGADDAPQFATDPARRGLSRKWIVRSVEESLSRLGTDYIDLYQTHVYDAETPRDETSSALDDLVRQGKVLACGEAATNTSLSELISTQELADERRLTPLASVQAKYNLLARDAEKELIPELQRRGMSLIPYYPLASGLLTGKYQHRGQYPPGSRFEKIPLFKSFVGEGDWDTLDALQTFAGDHQMSMTELAIAWLIAQPSVASVIAGATRPEQILANVAAASAQLSQADIDELNSLSSAG
jgi:aryl-alcohol dehydrogenase-like predicted oxidoreductase